MSVLECDRYGCDNIMCSRLILNGTRYICDSCWNELLAYKQSWPDTMHGSVRDTINYFMDTSPGNILERDIEIEFERLTNE